MQYRKMERMTVGDWLTTDAQRATLLAAGQALLVYGLSLRAWRADWNTAVTAH
jgi:hypothetical protein